MIFLSEGVPFPSVLLGEPTSPHGRREGAFQPPKLTFHCGDGACAFELHVVPQLLRGVQLVCLVLNQLEELCTLRGVKLARPAATWLVFEHVCVAVYMALAPSPHKLPTHSMLASRLTQIPGLLVRSSNHDTLNE
eukprot:1606415-Pyramimonas_sp.AAC.1